MKKTLKNSVVVLLLFVPLLWFAPWVALVFAVCGIYDVLRNKRLDGGKIAQYFTGNGLFTWILSPLNALFDLLALPFLNKGIYKLEDLPKGYQDEIKSLVDTAARENLVQRLEEKTAALPRAMIFFKWYGQNRDNWVDIPDYHRKFRYIRTIGVSVFNRRESTSRHFGPLRATLRVLYNINTITEPTAFIEVGDTKNYWRDEKLFVFDDTLLHQSFNESDSPRYCLFVDVLRPSLIPPLFSAIVAVNALLLKGINSVFYKNWKVIK